MLKQDIFQIVLKITVLFKLNCHQNLSWIIKIHILKIKSGIR